ncbi:Mu transposase C-terminal domain-containing protein [Clostridium botulinum]|uniref:Mu transposase C-terminal domain-containing protein n=1 Tax=Clostridium botulinum TaxID=1491 RepID=UPI001C9A7CA0|nr:Mu transposase C-terminal domain-containing protein [Clostridium botulinum]MBY6811680.1 DDE-type integrase/transposase/recombinase [Clostridium botulinum]MBY6825331.1 DDE-type integrase/transposase/recombinase [Clostridium botulinum]MBY6835453.1 DDE-type integrase/transposase/recombinase [Clostridium botulinum]MBY6973888.1 DDE-type integrase/transposase/recombinase [Clostridium botulinum]MCS6105335.1 hypothetical protein [Clostridium botulinum]
MIYRENMIVKIEEEEFRICDFDKSRDNLFLIDIHKKCSLPFAMSSEQLNRLFKENKAKEIIEKGMLLSDNANVKERLLEKRDFYYETVCFLFSRSKDYEIYYRDKRTPIINEAMKKYNISYSTIKRILCIYLQSGKIRDSLIDNLQNCGGKGKERVIKNRKNGIVIDDKIKKIFKEGINKYYNTSKKNSIKICYELIVRDYLKDDKEKVIPTFKQLYYWYKKFSQENKKIEISKRYGDRIYQQTSRSIIGNSLQDALAPADLYQIDSTILDVYIVSKLNRNLIIGRPVLYLVIDVYSRMIVGMNVTIEPFNSYQGVKEALINTMSDKVSYCKKHGIDIKKEEWDVCCVPSRILADRGELLSHNIENSISNLGIIIQNTPPYRGDMKGIVEKSFERMHSYIKPFVDGVVENKFNKVERGAEDYRLKANLTLGEITQIIIKCVLFHNNKHVLINYESDGLTIENNISKIPKKIWAYGIRQKKVLLRELQEEIIKINLLNNKEVNVTAKGVKFNKLFYVSKYTLQEGWFQKARIEGSFKIKVSYNPNNLSEIYYIKANGNSYDTLTIVTYMEQYKDMSEEEVNKVFEYQDKMNKESSELEIREKLALFDEIENITQKAKEEQLRSKNNTISKTQRLKNIRENLEEERKLFRNNTSEDDDYINEEINEFNKIMNAEWSDYYE